MIERLNQEKPRAPAPDEHVHYRKDGTMQQHAVNRYLLVWLLGCITVAFAGHLTLEKLRKASARPMLSVAALWSYQMVLRC